jgi:uncharacterized protein (UPF0332 family)
MAEATALDPDVTPRAVIHSAYYAMFHAALAVLLIESGSFPKKHASVIGLFGALVKDRSPEHRDAAHNLNKIEELRIKADYSHEVAIDESAARSAREKAAAFLDLCARDFGFARRVGGPHG